MKARAVQPETWTHWTATPGIRWQAREDVRARVFALLLIARAVRDPGAREQVAHHAAKPLILRMARARMRRGLYAVAPANDGRTRATGTPLADILRLRARLEAL